MNLALSIIDLPLLLDLLALAASAVLIGFLIVNRRRYGHMVAAPQPKTTDFTAAMTVQMLTQQSQRSYNIIQKTLNQEFANLQRMAGCDDAAWPATGKTGRCKSGDNATVAVGRQQARRYDEAAQMMRNGTELQVIAKRCGLSRAEIDLIAYLQQQPSG